MDIQILSLLVFRREEASEEMVDHCVLILKLLEEEIDLKYLGISDFTKNLWPR